MLRFANNCKSKDKITGHITVPEMKRATTTIIKIIRRESFGNELKKTLKCVCGRQRFIASRWAPKKRVLTTDMKHQILMPKKHMVTSLFISETHTLALHGGPRLVAGMIR